MIGVIMFVRAPLPTDPLERRRLWREWIHMDTPAIDRHARPTVSRAIAGKADATASDWLPDMLDAPPGVIHGLKRAIQECLVGPTLPIADRERLIRRSIKLGLNRFEANLLIAAVQNRARAALPSVRSAPPQAVEWSLGRLLALGVLVEAIVAVALARSFF